MNVKRITLITNITTVLILAFTAIKLNENGLSGLRNIIIVLAFAVIIIGIIAASLMKKIINKQMNDLIFVAGKLVKGQVDVEINSTQKDEFGELMTCFKKITDNIRSQAEIAQRIAFGDFSVDVLPKSDKDILAISLKSVLSSFKALSDETKMIKEASINGQLETRGNADAFQGGFRQIVEGFNATLDGITEPLQIALDFVQKAANGEDLEDLENHFNGQQGVLINNLQKVKESLYVLLEETALLTGAAERGEFSYRPNLSRLKGGYRQIVESVSDAFDLMIVPLNMSAKYLKAIGKGEIPEIITDEYLGDFNDIKNSINDCIDGLGGLAEGRDILGDMSVNNYTKRVEGSYLGIYAEIAVSINAVSDRVRNTIRILNNIASGDLSDLEPLRAVGRRSESDTLIPSIISMIANIQFLIDEATLLTNATIEGKLDTTSDSSRFKGAWKNLVEGMNSILEEIAKPLKDVTEVMELMSVGNLKVAVKGTYKGDFNVLTQAIGSLTGTLSGVVNEISFIIDQIADGNLALERVKEYRGDYVNISTSLNVIIGSLNSVMGEISEASDQVSVGSRQVSEGSQALSQGSTEQASSIQELTASISEIASQTKQNAVDANEANKLATEARDNAVRGNQQMQEMLSSMEDISESSSNISKIIKVIDDIAFQTNILALNAAVEAARAGQHGKGFAVVAEEVRSLAARSAEAAKDTTNLIEGSISKVQHGTRIANETASALTEIVEGIEKSANLVSNIATASNEQASGITQVNKGIEQVSQVVQNNSATAEESAAASEELSSQAVLLKEMVSRFKLNKSKKSLSGKELKLLNSKDVESDKVSLLKQEPKILLDEGEFDKY